MRSLLAITPESEAMADVILALELIAAKAGRDARHISVETFHQMNLLLTWNIRHTTNAYVRVSDTTA